MKKEDGQQNRFIPHRWFAWYPVKTEDTGWVWLKDVDRQLEWKFNSSNPEDAVAEWRYNK